MDDFLKDGKILGVQTFEIRLWARILPISLRRKLPPMRLGKFWRLMWRLTEEV